MGFEPEHGEAERVALTTRLPPLIDCIKVVDIESSVENIQVSAVRAENTPASSTSIQTGLDPVSVKVTNEVQKKSSAMAFLQSSPDLMEIKQACQLIDQV